MMNVVVDEVDGVVNVDVELVDTFDVDEVDSPADVELVEVSNVVDEVNGVVEVDDVELVDVDDVVDGDVELVDASDVDTVLVGVVLVEVEVSRLDDEVLSSVELLVEILDDVDETASGTVVDVTFSSSTTKLETVEVVVLVLGVGVSKKHSSLQ